MSDYVHRIGRVGRVGSPGTCFALSFVSHKSDVELLWKIEVVTSVTVYFLTTTMNTSVFVSGYAKYSQRILMIGAASFFYVRYPF